MPVLEGPVHPLYAGEWLQFLVVISKMLQVFSLAFLCLKNNNNN